MQWHIWKFSHSSVWLCHTPTLRVPFLIFCCQPRSRTLSSQVVREDYFITPCSIPIFKFKSHKINFATCIYIRLIFITILIIPIDNSVSTTATNLAGVVHTPTPPLLRGKLRSTSLLLLFPVPLCLELVEPVRVPSIDRKKLITHLQRIIIISYLKPYSNVQLFF